MSEGLEEYTEKVQDQIREWTGRISDLKSKADRAPAEAKIGMLNQIAELTRRKEQLMALVEELRREENHPPDRIKNEIEKEAADIDAAYREAIRLFH